MQRLALRNFRIFIPFLAGDVKHSIGHSIGQSIGAPGSEADQAAVVLAPWPTSVMLAVSAGFGSSSAWTSAAKGSNERYPS